MALYNFLPVYKHSYDLLIDLFKFTKELKREYKYTIGEDIKKETVAMIRNIYQANSSASKKSFIQAARENLETIRLYLRLSKDLKQINIKNFVKINEKIELISKQFFLWQRSI